MKVLIVEDYQDQLSLLAIVVKRSKNVSSVIECRTLECALQKVFDGDVDVVILDLMLPDGDGERVLETIKHYNLKRRVIVLSAVPAERLDALAHIYPDVMVLPKVFSVDHFDYLSSL